MTTEPSTIDKEALWRSTVLKHTTGGSCNFRDAAFEFAEEATRREREAAARTELKRWGFDRSGQAQQMDDGYWTPWHIAQAAVAQAEERALPPLDEPSREALEAMLRGDEYYAERWRKELRACLVELLYVAHESASPAECKNHRRYGDVMGLIDRAANAFATAAAAWNRRSEHTKA